MSIERKKIEYRAKLARCKYECNLNHLFNGSRRKSCISRCQNTYNNRMKTLAPKAVTPAPQTPSATTMTNVDLRGESPSLDSGWKGGRGRRGMPMKIDTQEAKGFFEKNKILIGVGLAAAVGAYFYFRKK